MAHWRYRILNFNTTLEEYKVTILSYFITKDDFGAVQIILLQVLFLKNISHRNINILILNSPPSECS